MESIHPPKGKLIHLPGKNNQGFEALFLQFHAPLCYFAYTMLKDQQGAKDIVEDCIVKLWKRPEVRSRPDSIKAWLYSAVHNACIEELRTVKRMKDYTRDSLAINDREDMPVFNRIIEVETLRLIFQTMNCLPPKYDLIFRMYYLEGKQLNEIAKELNISLSTVSYQKARALELLKKRMPHLSELLVLLSMNDI